MKILKLFRVEVNHFELFREHTQKPMKSKAAQLTVNWTNVILSQKLLFWLRNSEWNGLPPSLIRTHTIPPRTEQSQSRRTKTSLTTKSNLSRFIYSLASSSHLFVQTSNLLQICNRRVFHHCFRFDETN